MKTSIHTDLVGRELIFRDMPNEQISGKRGIIRAVRTRQRDSEILFTVEIPDGTLIEWAGHEYFKLLPKA